MYLSSFVKMQEMTKQTRPFDLEMKLITISHI